MNCIMAQDDILGPDSSPELLGAVSLPQFVLYAQRGWQAERGALAKSRLKGTLARASLCVFCVAMGVDVK